MNWCSRLLKTTLGVHSSASREEIKEAYEKLIAQLLADSANSTGGADGRRHLIDNAYWILSDAQRRSIYDAGGSSQHIPLKLSVQVKERKSPLQKTVLILFGVVLVMGIVTQVGFMMLGGRRAASMAGELRREKIMLEEQKQEMGYMTAKEREADAQRREEYEQQRQEEERKRAEARQARELEESRRYADRVSRELRDAEAQAQREAEYERQRKEREEEIKRRQEEERLARLRRGLY